MKRFGVMLGLFVAFVAGVVLLNILPRTETTVAGSLTEDGISEEEVQIDLSSNGASPSVGESNLESGMDQEFSNRVEERAEASAETRPYESQAVKNNAISSDYVIGTDGVEENFSRLVEEFLSADYGTETREQFQRFFYGQNRILSGEVSLDVLECGRQLCVAELRSTDASALRSFMDNRRDWEGFESSAILEVPAQHPNIARLIFSHVPEINGIELPSIGG